jgi:KaiC/GvpD/RAD55 family RecA-like ATPase
MPRDSVRFAHYGVEEFLADTIVHLRMKEVDVGVSTSVRRYVGVVKMRGVDHDLDYFPLLVEDGEFEIVSE